MLALLLSVVVTAQTSITGNITDSNGIALNGVNVVEKDTNNGATSDFDGNYTITANYDAILVFSYVGFETQEVPVNSQSSINISMTEGFALDAVQLVGSRSPKRTATDTPVAIDVISVNDVITQAGKIEINELLQYAAPSFNANKQSGSDGADHVDPASLRGLGPDQTLVLINGKRRHQSSLVNIFGTRGRGNTGTDLNAIPTSAIKRIEILRDGAAAQYGSDAIAGVINIVLKDGTDDLTGFLSYGAYSTNADVDTSDFQDGDYGVWNTDGFRLDTDRDGNAIGDDQSFDGGSVKAGVNYGVKLGTGGGFANFTAEYLSKNKTLRPAFDFRKGFGEAAIDGFNFMGNLAYPVSEKTEIYAFGGRNYRDTDAFAFTRNGGTRVIPSIYPNGFTPRITSNIIYNSVSVGVRTELGNEWNADISNTWGKNSFHYFIKGTLNASLQDASPTDFDAGGHTLSQNTVNLDFSKYFEDVANGLNVAFGGEYRTENFTIFAGEAGSYGTFDENGVLITNPADQTQPVDPESGDVRPGGSQGFPGYSPANEVDRSRSNVSLYADAEVDLSESFLLTGAARFENYSDFGSTINGKLATRLKVGDNINLRASASTGFRAPSLVQIYYNLRFTNFIGGVAVESVLSPNNSPVTASLGIGPLKEETAFNAGLGVTAKFGAFTATVDGYLINIKDRIVLTGNFTEINIPGIEAAQAFANGADTETLGVDVVLSYRKKLGNGTFGATLIGNVNDMEITDVKNGSLDEQTFFGERDKAFLLASAPDNKFALNLTYGIDKWNFATSVTHFSDVELLDFQVFEDPADYGGFDNLIAAATDTYEAKFVTDLTIGYQLSEGTKFSIGSNNLLNVYPDQQDDWTEAGGYWDSVQMGFGGAYYFARLDFNF